MGETKMEDVRMRMLCIALAICSATSLRMEATVRSPRTTTIRMGLSKGAQFPVEALDKFGVAGKKAVIFFFGADDAPSCSKQIEAFDNKLAAFANAGVSVCGVRNGDFLKRRYP